MEINGLKLLANKTPMLLKPGTQPDPPCGSISCGNEENRGGDSNECMRLSNNNPFASISSSICGEELLASEVTFEKCSPSNTDESKLKETDVELEHAKDPFAMVLDLDAKEGNGSITKFFTAAPEVLQEKRICGTSCQNIFEQNCLPFWGFTTICGRRPEMEDAVSIVPQFSRIPIRMLSDNHVSNGMNGHLCNSTAHFFGVYDGHGGSQVCFMPLFF